MVPVLSVVGPSSSGKTTLIGGIVPHLVSWGHRVGVIQRHSHGESEIDRRGKDKWRHARTDAVAVALSSPVQLPVT